MLSSQLWEAVQRTIPDAIEQIRRGDLSTINRWMGQTVQGEGGKFTFAEVAEHATGSEFASDSYLRHLTKKYGEIYHLA
jgi:carboxypeptidase Taq